MCDDRTVSPYLRRRLRSHAEALRDQERKAKPKVNREAASPRGARRPSPHHPGQAPRRDDDAGD